MTDRALIAQIVIHGLYAQPGDNCALYVPVSLDLLALRRRKIEAALHPVRIAPNRQVSPAGWRAPDTVGAIG